MPKTDETLKELESQGWDVKKIVSHLIDGCNAETDSYIPGVGLQSHPNWPARSRYAQMILQVAGILKEAETEDERTVQLTFNTIVQQSIEGTTDQIEHENRPPETVPFTIDVNGS